MKQEDPSKWAEVEAQGKIPIGDFLQVEKPEFMEEVAEDEPESERGASQRRRSLKGAERIDIDRRYCKGCMLCKYICPL